MNAKKCFNLLLSYLGDGTGRTATSEIDGVSLSDWDQVVRLAVGHDVAPLLFDRLRKSGGAGDVPSAIVRRLQEIYFYNAARNMRIYSDFSEVCKLLAHEGIEVIALKGLHLAEVVYEDIGVRNMSDMDLLVRRRDLSKAQDVLLGMGYGPGSRVSIDEQCSAHNHLIPFKKKGAPPIEIHWNITLPHSPFTVKMDELWERARRRTIADVSVLILSPEDLLIHLCLHASFQHRFTSFALKNACDIRETIGYYGDEIDWGRMVSTAGDPEMAGYLLCTLQLTRGLLGTEMPLLIRNIMRSKDSDRELVDNLFRRVLFPSPSERLVASSLLRPVALDMLKNEETLLGKARIFVDGLFPSVGHVREKYSLPRGSRKVCLFYLFHLLDVFVRGLLLMIPESLKRRRAEFRYFSSFVGLAKKS